VLGAASRRVGKADLEVEDLGQPGDGGQIRPGGAGLDAPDGVLPDRRAAGQLGA
jgi:hypothetical protein